MSIYVSRLKIAEERVFWFFFSDFFRILTEKFFRLLAKKLQKVLKTTFYVSRGTVCGLKFFLKFCIVLDFLQKPSAWFSNFYIRVKCKNCGRNSFLIFSFQNFLGFWAKIFSDFRRKIFKNLSKLPSACLDEQFVAWNIFWKFWIVLIFSAETFGMVLKFLSTCPEYKKRKKQFFLFSFQKFFDFWAKLFQTFGQIFKKLWKLPSACPQEQLVASKIFKTFWTVLDFLQKPLAWFSNFYLGVQSKNCGRNSFLIFLFRIFSDFERKIFPTFGQKMSRIFQNYLLRVQRNNLWLEFFLSFESFPIFCRNHWHGSQNSIYESRLKIAEKNSFFVFFSEFFRFLSETFSDFWPNLQKVVKTTFCVSRGTNCGLKSFLKVLNQFGFSAETFGMVLKFLFTCPE